MKPSDIIKSTATDLAQTLDAAAVYVIVLERGTSHAAMCVSLPDDANYMSDHAVVLHELASALREAAERVEAASLTQKHDC